MKHYMRALWGLGDSMEEIWWLGKPKGHRVVVVYTHGHASSTKESRLYGMKLWSPGWARPTVHK